MDIIDYIPEPPQGVVDFSAGFGDTISFGLTDVLREQLGTNEVVNKCSVEFKSGEFAGFGVGIALPGATVQLFTKTRKVGKIVQNILGKTPLAKSRKPLNQGRIRFGIGFAEKGTVLPKKAGPRATLRIGVGKRHIHIIDLGPYQFK